MEIDVANNIRSVELLKVELLDSIASFYGEIAAEACDETPMNIADSAAKIIVITKVLCRRLGVDFELINAAMCEKLKCEIANGHITERRFGDLSAVLREMGEESICNEKYEG